MYIQYKTVKTSIYQHMQTSFKLKLLSFTAEGKNLQLIGPICSGCGFFGKKKDRTGPAVIASVWTMPRIAQHKTSNVLT